MKMHLDDSLQVDGEKQPYEAIEFALKDKFKRYPSANARKLLREKASGISIIEKSKEDHLFCNWILEKIDKHNSNGMMHTIHYLRVIVNQYVGPVKELTEDV